jgi:hypothetical protein
MAKKAKNPNRVPLERGTGSAGVAGAGGGGVLGFLANYAATPMSIPNLVKGPVLNPETGNMESGMIQDGIKNAAEIAAHVGATPRDVMIGAGLGLAAGVIGKVASNRKLNRNLNQHQKWSK